jgi:hypothetical protein
MKLARLNHPHVNEDLAHLLDLKGRKTLLHKMLPLVLDPIRQSPSPMQQIGRKTLPRVKAVPGRLLNFAIGRRLLLSTMLAPFSQSLAGIAVWQSL